MAATEDSTASRLAAMKMRRDELELEVLESQVSAMRAKKLATERDRARQEHEIREAEKALAARQENCKHHKGGRGKDGLENGNAPEWSVITNTYPTGNKEVMCLRCQKTWAEPEPALKKVDPKLYAQQMKEWQDALKYPTDNEPSGKRLFLIERVAA